ncbi:hypothetical protein [Ureaplasma diversum]|uniref:Lipoprotein n=1 Tax=Ureaplasma diversum NCTC 246 TaxID=1188241 RepID=A0A084EZ07_9BACT|nr:hypothetical protein [Ureaplasma diversum]KEZ23199.1 Hypothetical protein, predicted lipoprotein [Ureaplasma diversum NCTC 246]
MKIKKIKYKWMSLAIATTVAAAGISAVLISCTDKTKGGENKKTTPASPTNKQTAAPSVSLDSNSKLTKRADNKYELKLKITNADSKLVKVELTSQSTNTNNSLISDLVTVTSGSATVVFNSLDENTSYSLKKVSVYATNTDTNPTNVELSQSLKATQITVLKSNEEHDHSSHMGHNGSGSSPVVGNGNTNNKEKGKQQGTEETNKGGSDQLQGDQAPANPQAGDSEGYKISFVDPNMVIFQKNKKWYIQLRVDVPDGFKGSVQVTSEKQPLNTKAVTIKNKILEAEFSGPSFLGTIKPNKKYKLGRVNITDLEGKEKEIRHFDSSISNEITPVVEGGGSAGSSKPVVQNDPANNPSSSTNAKDGNGVWFENNATEITATLKDGKYTFKAYVEKKVSGTPSLAISKPKSSGGFKEIGKVEFKDVSTPEPGKGDLQEIEIPQYIVKEFTKNDQENKAHLTKLEFLNEDLDVVETIDLSSKGLVVIIPKQ